MFIQKAMRGVYKTTSSCLLLATVDDISPFSSKMTLVKFSKLDGMLCLCSSYMKIWGSVGADRNLLACICTKSG